MRDIVYGKDVDLGKAAVSLGMGGIMGLLGGPGLKSLKQLSCGKLYGAGKTFGVYNLKFKSAPLANTFLKEFLKGSAEGLVHEFLIDGDTIRAVVKLK